MKRRQGFTIVELLVSTALIVFLMAILSEAFVAGIKTFRDLKAVGDLNQRLRSVSTILRDDLAADHFPGKRRLSDSNFWADGPPREGFFRIWQGSALDLVNPAAPYYREGFDLDGVDSVRATNHFLHFAIKKRGNNQQDFLSAKIGFVAGPPPDPPSPLPLLGLPDSRYQEQNDLLTFNSQWAEVVWFLQPNGSFAGSSPLYALYRRQLVAVPDNSLNWDARKVPVQLANRYLELSAKVNPKDTTSLYFNNPTDLTVPQRRFGMDPAQDGGLFANPNRGYPILGDPGQVAAPNATTGADLVMTDVLSFSVRVMIAGNNDFMDLSDPRFQAFSSDNPQFYSATSTPPRLTSPAVFDTWSAVKDDAYDYTAWAVKTTATTKATATTIPIWHNAAGTAIRIIALQITIRIWDLKSEQTRQITVIQDM